MLHYQNCNLPFLVFPDASDKQLGAHGSQIENKNADFTNVAEVLKQNHHPVSHHSRKMNDYQTNYPVTDKKLLSAVDTLLVHENVLHSAITHVHSDHKNLTHANASHASARAQRQRLVLDEFGCTIVHIPGEQNSLAGALSRFGANDKNEEEKVEEMNRLRATHNEKNLLFRNTKNSPRSIGNTQSSKNLVSFT